MVILCQSHLFNLTFVLPPHPQYILDLEKHSKNHLKTCPQLSGHESSYRHAYTCVYMFIH